MSSNNSAPTYTIAGIRLRFFVNRSFSRIRYKYPFENTRHALDISARISSAKLASGEENRTRFATELIIATDSLTTYKVMTFRKERKNFVRSGRNSKWVIEFGESRGCDASSAEFCRNHIPHAIKKTRYKTSMTRMKA